MSWLRPSLFGGGTGLRRVKLEKAKDVETRPRAAGLSQSGEKLFLATASVLA